MPSRFLQRAQKEIAQKLGRILSEINDPRLNGQYTLSYVRLSADLSHLKCYFVINERPEVQQGMLDALKAAAPFLRRRLGESIHLRKTPEVHVYHDDTPEQAERIEGILRGLQEAGQLPGAASAPVLPPEDVDGDVGDDVDDEDDDDDDDEDEDDDDDDDEDEEEED